MIEQFDDWRMRATVHHGLPKDSLAKPKAPGADATT